MRGGWVATTALLMTTGAVQADISPDDAWQSWKDYMTSFGYEISATEEMSGGTLIVSDIEMRIDVPEEAMDVSLTLGDIAFVDRGDGSVAVQLPSSLPMRVEVTGPDAVEMDVAIDTVGFEMTISGDPDNSVSAYSANSMSMALVDVTVDGAALSALGEGAPIRDMSFTMTDLAGETKTLVGALRQMEQMITTGTWTYTVDIVDPDNAQGSILINGGGESLRMFGDLSVPEGIDINDMSAAMAAGLSIEGGYEFGPGSMQFRFDEGGSVTEGRTTSAGGDLGIIMDASQLVYRGGSKDLTFEMSGADIPFPLAMDMARSGFELKMPVMKGDAPQAFGLELLFQDFTMSEFIWALFDPAAQLPRDPATIALDLSGMASLFIDLLDPVQMSALDPDGMVPGEVNSLSLDTLTLSAAGARLTGSGAFEIDNDDTATYDGFPKPVGTISLNLTGANALLDNLVALGFLPEDQAMGARMMMGLFAVAGEGADELNSVIEFTEGGQVLANGQRLR